MTLCSTFPPSQHTPWSKVNLIITTPPYSVCFQLYIFQIDPLCCKEQANQVTLITLSSFDSNKVDSKTKWLIISTQTYLQTVLPSSSMQEVREGKQQSASGPPRRSSRRGAHARTTIWCHVALQTEESGSTRSCTRIGQRHPKAPRRSLSSGVTWLIRSLVG